MPLRQKKMLLYVQITKNRDFFMVACRHYVNDWQKCLVGTGKLVEASLGSCLASCLVNQGS